MTNTERLLEFFDCENRRDWGKYRTYLCDDVSWVMIDTNESSVGIDDFMNGVIEAYKNSTNTFTVESLLANESEDKIAVFLKNNHGNLSCDIFDFYEGKIQKEYEYIVGI